MAKVYNPNKGIYVPDQEFWEQVQAKASRSDIDRGVSQIVIRLLEMWLNGEAIPYPEKESE